MTEHTRFDRVLPGLFEELANAQTPHYLEAAIERASSRAQRPAWTDLAWWLPTQVRTEAAPTARAWVRQAVVLAVIGVLVALAVAAYVGTRPAPRTAPPFGPAGNGIVAVEKDGDLYVADRPGGALRPLAVGPEDDRFPRFSPDGTRLAFARTTDAGSFLVLADADGANLVEIPLEPFLDNTSLWSFAPDARSLMTVAQIDGVKRVVIRPVDPAAALTVLDLRMPCCWMDVEDPMFRPTNAQEILVVAEPDGQRGLYVYDLASAAMRTIVAPGGGSDVQHAAWLPDGRHIVYRLSGQPRIVAADGSGDRALDAQPWDQISPASNDGTRIVVDRAEVDGQGDDSHQTSVIEPIDGSGQPVQLACGRGTTECAWSWVWSPDDSMLLGTVPHETSSTYLLADARSGGVSEVDWAGVATLSWQRVAP